jgi:hypothetical protein
MATPISKAAKSSMTMSWVTSAAVSAAAIPARVPSARLAVCA